MLLHPFLEKDSEFLKSSNRTETSKIHNEGYRDDEEKEGCCNGKACQKAVSVERFQI